MKITFLAEPTAVAGEWPRIAPLIERCITEAVCGGEFTTDDLYERSMNGAALPFYVEDEEGVTVAGVLEIVTYPRRAAINVMALAGRRLADSADGVFEEIKQFGRAIGVDYIEASAAPAMARLLNRKLGFEPHYQVLRINLKGVSREKAEAA